MKEFRLAAWPELPAQYQRRTYRRMLNDMSYRYVSLAQLTAGSGASRQETRSFLQMLAERGLLLERDLPRASVLGSLRPLGGWLRHALGRTGS